MSVPSCLRHARSPRVGPWRLSLRWSGGVALLALTPKCLLCAAAYLGLGAAFGLGGPELCGTAPTSVPMRDVLTLVGCSVAVAAPVFAGLCRRRAYR